MHPARVLRFVRPALLGFSISLALAAAVSVTPSRAATSPSPRPIARRALDVRMNGRWIGNAVAYGPHRDGQSPGGAQPTRAQLREDLHLIAKHWNLLRVYGSRGASEDMLAIIREEHLPLRVVLGAWVAVTERRDASGAVIASFPEARTANRGELEMAVKLAKQYPGIVAAICVGNETQVAWSDHVVPADSLIASLRWVRARTRVPVTTADDFNFWNKPQSQAVAREVDFVFMHAHPMWNGRQIADALAWTDTTVASIRAAHPGMTVVLGETGWATSVGTEGDQAKYIKGQPGETEQKTFVDACMAWAERTRTTVFMFEAFDENWKGSNHPDEVEKHWGLFRADRTPKLAVAPR